MMGARYLRQIHVERYGALSDFAVGPFEPGMNVVVGPNEAGKSTLSSLVGGVLFGWEEAHGVRNTYRPPTGERAGRLEWAQAPGIGAQASPASQREAFLRRDESGVTGDLAVVDDIDRPTFDTLFSLRADELRSLRGSSDITARLLSAGSGTEASPSVAFIEVEGRIVQATVDIKKLEQQLEDKRGEVKRASEQVDLLMQKDRELHALVTSRATAAGRAAELNDEIEDLVAGRAELESLDERAAARAEELAVLYSELEEAAAPPSGTPKLDSRLLALDSAEERVLRDRLDEFAEAREKLDRVTDVAKENAASSLAAYEALMELSDEDVAASRRLRNRTSQAVVSVLLPVAFIGAGIPLFVHGRQITSLSFTALGIGLIVIAIFMAAAAFFVLFRSPDDGALDSRRQDAQWVMLQDRKKRDASLQETREFEDEVSRFLDGVGLSAANGSLRQACTLLDEASSQRADLAASNQKVSSLNLRIRAAEKDLSEIARARVRIVEAAGLPSDSTARDLGALVRERSAQRDALLDAAAEMSERFGELSRELAEARTDRSFDSLKLEYQQLHCRLRERKHDLMELLLAKRMLERSIIAWESRNQPEVYAHAGRLLAEITDGRWVEVATSPTGSIVAVASDGVARDPHHLSLGTCQQLYLALRIALLLVADDVGASVPVLADDLLVNFDAVRRAGAARALLDLARTRQVILFTCHEEVASLFPAARRIALMPSGR